MLALKEQAVICRIGLITELLTQQDVIRWADNIIATDGDPDYSVIDISLMGSSDLSALVSSLFELKGSADSDRVTDVVLGLCAVKLQRGDLSAGEAAAILGKLVPDISCSRCNIKAEYGAHVDEATTGRIRALLNEPGLINAIADFLSPYAAFAKEITFERA